LQPEGLSGRLLGIDIRPADGKLYGITSTNDVYRIDPGTGAATQVSSLTVPFDGDIRSGVDFNPQADRLRLVSRDGQNLRVNVLLGATAVDGPLAFRAGDVNAGTRTPARAPGGRRRRTPTPSPTRRIQSSSTSTPPPTSSSCRPRRTTASSPPSGLWASTSGPWAASTSPPTRPGTTTPGRRRGPGS